MPATCFAPAANAIRRLIELYGYDPGPHFKAQNISLKMTRDPNARLRTAQLLAVGQSFADQVDDPCFGLRIAEVAHPSHIGAMGYAWLASTTLRTAIDRALRFQKFTREDVVLEVEESRSRFTVIRKVQGRERDDVCWEADAALATFMWLCRLNAGPDFHPLSVELRHGEPSCSGNYYAFFRSPVNFGAKRNALTFSQEEIDQELDSANPNLAQLNDQIMIKAIARLRKSKIVDRACAAIIEALPSGGVTDDQIAKILDMSTRTFQRRLGEEDTSFQTLLTEVRQELARKYIRNSSLSLTEISFQLGFSEVSAFSSAFKRWTGRSPSEEREAA